MQLLKMIRVTCKREVKTASDDLTSPQGVTCLPNPSLNDENGEFIKSPTMHDQLSHFFRHLTVEGFSPLAQNTCTCSQTHTHTHNLQTHSVCRKPNYFIALPPLQSWELSTSHEYIRLT